MFENLYTKETIYISYYSLIWFMKLKNPWLRRDNADVYGCQKYQSISSISKQSEHTNKFKQKI